MKLKLIVAVAQNGVIGKDNDLPWRLKADLAHFKATTINAPIILGRKNYESIGRALPKRTNIVLTRNADFVAEGCVVLTSLQAALDFCKEQNFETAFIIGGAEIYKESLDLVNELIITRVLADVEGDVYLPQINWENWMQISSESHFRDSENQYNFNIEVWTKKS